LRTVVWPLPVDKGTDGGLQEAKRVTERDMRLTLEADFILHPGRRPLSLFTRVVTPAAPEAGLIFYHGSMVHSEYYMPWALELAQAAPITIWLPDLRGHGRSGGARGHVPAIRDYLFDIALTVVEFRRRWPELPLFLGGESFGGLLVFLAVSEIPSVQGLILSAPVFGLKADLSRGLKRIIQSADRILPFVRPLRPLGAEGIVRHPQWPRLIESDPLVIRKYPLHFLAELLRAQRQAENVAPLVSVPLLMLIAGQDHIVDNQAAERICQQVREPVWWKKFPDSWHALSSESPDLYQDTIVQFINTYYACDMVNPA